MNLFDSSFLCLDIGTSGVRGIAHRIKNAHIDKSAIYTVNSFDTIFALKSVIDELEKQLGLHFDSAYITGNFGESSFDMIPSFKDWGSEHKITEQDIKKQISEISAPQGFYAMQIIPLQYSLAGAKDVKTPIGYTDKSLKTVFGIIFYENERLKEIYSFLRSAHIQPKAFYSPEYLQYKVFKQKKQSLILIDLGAEFTTISIWTDRGPMLYEKIRYGGNDITDLISEKLNITFDEAEEIKKQVSCLIPKEMDRFTPASTNYDFSRADINEIVLPCILDIIEKTKKISASTVLKIRPTGIVLTGGGAEIEGIKETFENALGLPVYNMHYDASIKSLSEYIWGQESKHRQAYLNRQEKATGLTSKITSLFKKRKKKKKVFIPILPSSMCFDMKKNETYSLFKSGGISIIHIDIMDGFYVDKMVGSIEEIKYIRSHTKNHLHVHLMTESPLVWAQDAINAGADTVILSTNTSGVKAAIKQIKASGRRVGIAINPESPVSIVSSVLREIDEVMVMTVSPGAAGQKFKEECVHKISVLAGTRKKYGLKFLISVDGGINAETAQQCWSAGADLLVSGSYLANSSDFPLAVQSLLKKQ